MLFIYITRLASNEIFEPSNKKYWEVGRAKDLSVHILCEWVCSLSQPARKAHAPHYILSCDLSGCTVFFSGYLIMP